MGEEAGDESGPFRAFHKLCRTDEHAVNHAHQSGAGEIAGGDVADQLRAARHGGAVVGAFLGRAHGAIEPPRIAEILSDEIVQALLGDAAEELVQPTGKAGFGKTSRLGAVGERQFANWKKVIAPVVGQARQYFNGLFGGRIAEILNAVALQLTARLGNDFRRQPRFGLRVDQKKIWQAEVKHAVETVPHRHGDCRGRSRSMNTRAVRSWLHGQSIQSHRRGGSPSPLCARQARSARWRGR